MKKSINVKKFTIGIIIGVAVGVALQNIAVGIGIGVVFSLGAIEKSESK